MRIVFVANWHSEKMGYSDNMLPKAMARLGHEVHLITSTAQIYFNSELYDSTYRSYLGPPIVAEGSKIIDGYSLHRLPLAATREIKIKGLMGKISELKPDIVQTFEIDRDNVYPLATNRERIGYSLFTEMHLHASVFPNYRNRSMSKIIKWYLKIGRFLSKINSETTYCYPISEDCADIAQVIYNVPASKIKVQSLGTDTELFKPVSTSFESDRRNTTRIQYGFSQDDIVCVYTGRIAKDKGPALLAKAIDLLQRKGQKRFKGFFIGAGEPEEVTLIRRIEGCVVKDFVPVVELPAYYQASDIAVWPTQESTSQLDAIACGLPLIINDTVTVKERIEGNGLMYKLMDPADLAEKLMELENPQVRGKMGEAGHRKAERKFSWKKIAVERLADYAGS